MDLVAAREAVDAAFDGMGVEARYGTGEAGDGDPCAVILWRPRSQRGLAGFKISEFGVAEAALYVLVRRAEVAAPLTLFAFRLEETGAVYRIGEDTPVPHDIHGFVWRCAVVLEG